MFPAPHDTPLCVAGHIGCRGMSMSIILLAEFAESPLTSIKCVTWFFFKTREHLQFFFF